MNTRARGGRRGPHVGPEPIPAPGPCTRPRPRSPPCLDHVLSCLRHIPSRPSVARPILIPSRPSIPSRPIITTALPLSAAAPLQACHVPCIQRVISPFPAHVPHTCALYALRHSLLHPEGTRQRVLEGRHALFFRPWSYVIYIHTCINICVIYLSRYMYNYLLPVRRGIASGSARPTHSTGKWPRGVCIGEAAVRSRARPRSGGRGGGHGRPAGTRPVQGARVHSLGAVILNLRLFVSKPSCVYTAPPRYAAPHAVPHRPLLPHALLNPAPVRLYR